VARIVEPPFVVHRDRSPGGAEIVTTVPIAELFKLQRAARAVMWKALQGDPAAKATIEGIFAQAHAEEGSSENRGSAVISTYLLNEAFQEIQQAREQAEEQAARAHAAQQRAQAERAAQQPQQAPPESASVGAAPVEEEPAPNHPMYVGRVKRPAEDQRAAYDAAAAEWKAQQQKGARV